MLLENGFSPTKNPKVPRPWGSLISTDRQKTNPYGWRLSSAKSNNRSRFEAIMIALSSRSTWPQIATCFRSSRLLYRISPDFTEARKGGQVGRFAEKLSSNRSIQQQGQRPGQATSALPFHHLTRSYGDLRPCKPLC